MQASGKDKGCRRLGRATTGFFSIHILVIFDYITACRLHSRFQHGGTEGGGGATEVFIISRGFAARSALAYPEGPRPVAFHFWLKSHGGGRGTVEEKSINKVGYDLVIGLCVNRASFQPCGSKNDKPLL